MARKIFVSYKHGDSNVAYVPEFANAEHRGQTARAYVDYLEHVFVGNQIYKGEGNEDLSEFKDSTIETHLKKKIRDSSITVVLISPQMKDPVKDESDQWIPWEVSYSLKKVTYGDTTSLANGMLAVVLPDRFGRYDYYIQYYSCNCRGLYMDNLFEILGRNMFNHINLQRSNCFHLLGSPSYGGDHSYIESVKWGHFLDHVDEYFERAKNRCDNIADYNITKEIPD